MGDYRDYAELGYVVRGYPPFSGITEEEDLRGRVEALRRAKIEAWHKSRLLKRPYKLPMERPYAMEAVVE